MKKFREDLISTYQLIKDKLSSKDKQDAIIFLERIREQYNNFEEPTFSIVESNLDYILQIKQIELTFTERRHIVSRIEEMYIKIFIEEDTANIINQAGITAAISYDPRKILWELTNLYMLVFLLNLHNPKAMDKLEKQFFKELDKISSIVTTVRSASLATIIAAIISYFLGSLSTMFRSMSFHYGLLAICFILFSEIYNVIRYRKTQTID